ncbi:response regulator [Rhizomicrobium electricum]|nr:response regulator [Rhizomicrobium electricum]
MSPETYDDPDAGRLSGARILVVEDEFVIAMQLQSIFEEEGAQVLGPYHNVADALEHAGSDDISAASLDVNLGRETAAPVASVLAERNVPFVFYSVQTNDPAIADWRHVTMIQKPAAPSDLIEAIATLVQRRTTEVAE